MSEDEQRAPIPPIYVVSGGTGSSGEQVVNTVLAQFPDAHVPVETVSGVRQPGQIDEVIARARASGGTIVHTMVEADLRRYLIDAARLHSVAAIDLMGPLLERLTLVIGQPPLGRPGFYRQLHRSYFERVAAIEYAMAHDDGQKPEDWPEADVVLIGVSRSGKTPLSIYLSVLGWKAANMPIVPEIPLPAELYELDRSRVIGLMIDMDRLLAFRRARLRLIGMPTDSSYASPLQVSKELNLARRIYRRGGFHVIDVTDRTVEASADEIMKRISQNH